MSIVREEKILKRLHKAAAAAALLIVGAMTAGCSHPAAAPAVPPTPSVAAPGVAPAPGAMAPSAAVASPMSAGDQQEMQQKQNESKGQAAPP